MQKDNSSANKKKEKTKMIIYCKNCGWKMEYIPRSFREYINEIIGGENKKGYWECPNCKSIKKQLK